MAASGGTNAGGQTNLNRGSAFRAGPNFGDVQMMTGRFATIGIAGVVLAGCGHLELVDHTMSAREYGDPAVYEAAAGLSPQGSAFTAALARNYLQMAEFEDRRGDWRQYEVYSRKALLANQGVVIEPTLPDRWDLEKLNYHERVQVVSYAEAYEQRHRMMNAFWKCTRNRAPEQAAMAQASFDKWVEELEEGWESEEIDAARDAFLEAVAAVEASCPPPSPPDSYVVYFDTARADIKPYDRQIIGEVARIVNEANASGDEIKLVHNIGWADTRGNRDYNEDLSQRRIDAVVQALVDEGVSADSISSEARGETRLPRPTGDGVAEFRNRVAHIIIYIKPVPPIPFSPPPAE